MKISDGDILYTKPCLLTLFTFLQRWNIRNLDIRKNSSPDILTLIWTPYPKIFKRDLLSIYIDNHALLKKNKKITLFHVKISGEHIFRNDNLSMIHIFFYLHAPPFLPFQFTGKRNEDVYAVFAKIGTKRLPKFCPRLLCTMISLMRRKLIMTLMKRGASLSNRSSILVWDGFRKTGWSSVGRIRARRWRMRRQKVPVAWATRQVKKMTKTPCSQTWRTLSSSSIQLRHCKYVNTMNIFKHFVFFRPTVVRYTRISWHCTVFVLVIKRSKITVKISGEQYFW